MADICGGLNVVEVGSGSIAAAIAGMVFADAGARVVKVEPPGGDGLRIANPSGSLVWNRGKESMVADLRTPDGRTAYRQLVGGADVVIEAFAPGTTDGWGVGPDALRADDPALVHCSITGFGRTGAYADLRAYDPIVAAKVGVWARGAFGYRDGPIVYPMNWASFGAAMQAVAGIAGALLVRDQTGRGQSVDATLVAGLDPIDYFVSTIVQLRAKQGEQAGGDARDAMAATRYGVLAVTRDGRFLQTSTLLPHQGKALCEVAGIGHVLDEPRFAKLPMFDTAEDAQDWEDLLLAAFRAHDLDHWLPLLEASPDIAYEVAVTSEEGLEHPQIVHNGDVVTVRDDRHGAVREVGPIGHFDRTPMRPRGSAPAVGAHGAPWVRSAPPTGTAAAPAHPFAGVTVVEFGYFYAMPYATAMLASLGARVIKIEDAKGDPHRASFGPEVASAKTTAGKESLSIDLKTDEGRRIAQEIVARADAFVTGFRSGIADKFGLGHDELRRLNPGLLYVHAAGYGTDGPKAHRALYAQAAQAVGGSFGRQVGYWSDPARNRDMSLMEVQAIVLPRLAHVIDGDSNAALALLGALSLGLLHQQRTGEGQFLRTSMIGGNALAYSDDFCAYDGKPPVPGCDEEQYGTSALDRVYRAADGSWVQVTVRGDHEFRRLLDATGLAELVADSRFATSQGRRDNDEELTDRLAARFRDKPAEEWESVLRGARVGCVAVQLQGQPVFTSFDPVLRETGLTVEVEHPLFGTMVRAAPAVRFSESSARVAPPCMRGEHNRALLAELGWSEGEIADLEARGIVIAPAP
ncbi:MAG TPA: CoA transferase [Acidimicrobiales bacterium]|nr:CoA transferase [Acidimicrobiales bacterium]